MLTVYLVRHGKSETNAGLPTLGPDHVGLTPHGLEQAQHIMAFLKSHTSLDLIVTSRYERTKQTAAPTASTFRSVPQDVWDVEEFTYLASLHHEFCTADYRRPLVDAYWEQCLPDYEESAGSESFKSFIKRAQATVDRLKYAGNKTIAIFSHEQFMCAIWWLVQQETGSIDISKEAMCSYKTFLDTHRIPNGGIIRMHYLHSQNRWGCTMIIDHLDPRKKEQKKIPVRLLQGFRLAGLHPVLLRIREKKPVELLRSLRASFQKPQRASMHQHRDQHRRAESQGYSFAGDGGRDNQEEDREREGANDRAAQEATGSVRALEAVGKGS